MDVIIDGERNFQFQGEPANVLSAIGAISDFLRSKGRDMVSLSVNGLAIRSDTVDTEFAKTPASAVMVIEVRSEDTVTMVKNCLGELESVLPELPSACQSLAQVFQSETPEDGYEPFQELANLWSHIKRREFLVTRALGLDLAGTEINGRSLAEAHGELNTFLEEAAQALRDGDCVLLGDLLEYELAPRAEMELQIVALLRQHAPG